MSDERLDPPCLGGEPEEADLLAGLASMGVAPVTLGDALDRALGGPEHFECWNCRQGLHSVCLGSSAGRTCECSAAPHPRRSNPVIGVDRHAAACIDPDDLSVCCVCGLEERQAARDALSGPQPPEDSGGS